MPVKNILHRDTVNSRMKRNVWIYYIYSAALQAAVWITFVVWVVFLRERGLGLLQITIIDAVFSISMALGEIPTGVVADKVGRKLSLLIGAFLDVGGLLVFVLSGQFALLVLANVILGIGMTFHSGAGTALLYESLQEAGKGELYTRVAGRVAAIGTAVKIVAGFAGSAIVTAGLIYPFIAGCGLLVIMLIVVLFMREPPKHGINPGEEATTNASQMGSYRSILAGATRVLRLPGVFSILLFMAVAGTISYLSALLIQPFATDLGSSASAVGIAVTLVNVGGVAGSLLAGKVSTDGIGKRLILLSPVAVAAFLFVAAFGKRTLWILVPCIVTRFVFSLIMPALGNSLNRRTPNAVRATVVSFRSVVSTALLTITEPVAGAVVDASGPRFGFAFIGCLAIFYSVYHMIRFRSRFASNM